MRILKQALLCCGIVMAASQASAAVINIEPPVGNSVTGEFLGNVYSPDGYTFTNTSGPNTTSYDKSDAYFNWKTFGGSVEDADYPGSTLDDFFSYTIDTSTKKSGGSFFFGGISLADVGNSPVGGTVDFTFNYANGTSNTASVELAMKSGLQAFAFNQQDVVSVAITTDPSNQTGTHELQFDYLVADSVSAVPLPASLPMFGAALLAMASVGYGLNRRTSQKGGIATAA